MWIWVELEGNSNGGYLATFQAQLRRSHSGRLNVA